MWPLAWAVFERVGIVPKWALTGKLVVRLTCAKKETLLAPRFALAETGDMGPTRSVGMRLLDARGHLAVTGVVMMACPVGGGSDGPKWAKLTA